MEEAKGVTFKKLIQDAGNRDAHDIKEIFTEMGTQFGNLYSMFSCAASSPFDEELSKTYHTLKELEDLKDVHPDRRFYKNLTTLKGSWHLVHPDPNFGNFMYEEEEKKISWIDLTGIKLTKYEDTKRFNQNTGPYLLFYVRDMLWEADEAQEAAKRNLLAENRDQAEIDLKKALSIIYAHQAFFHAYKAVLDEVRQTPLTINFIFNSIGSGLPYKKNTETFQRCGYRMGLLEELLKNIEGVSAEIYGDELNLLDGYSK